MNRGAGSAVVGAELRLVALRLRRPHVAAHGTEATRRVVLVRLVDERGRSGWGECSTLSDPSYSGESTAGAWRALCDELVPALLRGRRPDPAGHPMAVAALAGAVLCLEAVAAGTSLARLLARRRGVAPLPAVASTAVVGAADLDGLLDGVRRAVEDGHRHVKVKIHPGWDHRPLGAVRRAFPRLWLAADANGSYAAEPGLVDALARFGLAYVEQPLAVGDLAGAAELVRQGRVPIALDESVTSVAEVHRIGRERAAVAVNVKLARLAGPEAAVAALAAAREEGLAAWCGGMLETGVGRAMALAVAAQADSGLPADLGPSRQYFDDDIVSPELRLDASGALPVPRAPGLGVALRSERLDDVTLERWSLGEVAP